MQTLIVKTLKTILDEMEITLTDLSKASNIALPKLSRLLNQKQEMTLGELDLICKSINITPYEVVGRSHGDNLLPNKQVALETDREICKQPLLFDLLETLQLPHNKEDLIRLVNQPDKIVTKALQRLMELGLVYKNVHGDYHTHTTPFYESEEFYKLMESKFAAINKKAKAMGEVKEYWSNKSLIMLHAHLDEEQILNIKNMYRVILRLVENFQISNRASSNRNQKKKLTTLILVNHPFEYSRTT